MGDRIRVGVVFGGKSGEHDVSLNSATSVMRELDREKYEVVPIGITREGKWLVAGDPLLALKSAAEERTALPSGAEVEPATGNGLVPVVKYPGVRLPAIDVVFPVLHGPFGEDGTIQGLLEMANVPYVGAGVLASALGMDKVAQKDMFRRHGLPVVPDVLILRRRWDEDAAGVLQLVEERVGYPCFIKPANLGSSVGISKASNRQELIASLNLAAQFDRKLLVEHAVPAARELECGVLGNDELIPSVVGEIKPKREFYDYVAKYSDTATELLVPAPIPPEISAAIREMACEAFRALDCCGMARVDFLATQDLSELYVSEINTIPGFTSVSMYPRLFAAAGISYPDLLDRLVTLALERYADKNRNQTSWE